MSDDKTVWMRLKQTAISMALFVGTLCWGGAVLAAFLSDMPLWAKGGLLFGLFSMLAYLCTYLPPAGGFACSAVPHPERRE